MALFAASVAYGLVYAISPNIVPRRFRWVSPGALLGVVLWIVLSIAFGVYVQNFSTYGAAYGAFGAAIVLLLWLYLSANAFLFGGEFNAELERAERIGDGAPPAPSPPPSVRASRRVGARRRRRAGRTGRCAAGIARRVAGDAAAGPRVIPRASACPPPRAHLPRAAGARAPPGNRRRARAGPEARLAPSP